MFTPTKNLKLKNPSQQARPHRLKLTSGFTLVELLVSFSISAVLIVGIFSSFLELIKIQRKLLTFNHLQNTNNRILAQLKDDIRWGQVQLEPWSSNQLIIEVDDKPIIYHWSNNLLTRQTDLRTDSLQSDNVVTTEVSFENLTPTPDHLPLIGITLATKPTSPQQQFLQLENRLIITSKATTYEL